MGETKYTIGDWISTRTGRKFWPLNPKAEDVTIEDIAHALSHVCRFAGHTIHFYSVAQHSVLVSHFCKSEDALWGLLHDASDAYMPDIPRPVKHSKELVMQRFREIEDNILQCICNKFNLSLTMPESVKVTDTAILATEARDLLEFQVDNWHINLGVEFLDTTISPWPSYVAKLAFLERFQELKEITDGQ